MQAAISAGQKAAATRKANKNIPLLIVSQESVRQATAVYADDSAIVEAALQILKERMGGTKTGLNSPSAVRDYLRLTLAPMQHEVFVCVFMDAQNRVIASEEMFRGTLTQTSVYPREVVKAALKHNAGAVVLAHNHPSGVCQPSHADETLTQAIKQALSLVDVRVLDHFIIAGDKSTSFAERGLL